MSLSNSMPPNPPRSCHVVKSPDFNGYGFNLHTLKERPGQFIGVVDEGSPAEKANLKKGDRIVEVNGANISNENHKQVVTRVKQIENETTLLVVDSAADAWYKQHNIVITSHLPEVVKTSSMPRRRSSTPDDRHSLTSAESANSDREIRASDINGSDKVSDTKEDESHVAEEYDNVTFKNEDHKTDVTELIENKDEQPEADSTTHVDVKEDSDSSDDEVTTNGATETTMTNGDDNKSDSSEEVASELVAADKANSIKEEVVADKPEESNHKIETETKTATSSNTVSRTPSTSSGSSKESEDTEKTAPKQSPISASPSPPSSAGTPSPTPPVIKNNTSDIPFMNMTAAEMKAHLASRKKKDIRRADLTFKAKYDIVQRL